MIIATRRFVGKFLTPSTKNRLITKWNDGDPIEAFIAYEQLKFPIQKPDQEIYNEYHEITKARAEKLYAQKEEKLNPKEES